MTPERLAEVREYVKTGRLVTSLEHEMLAEIDRLRGNKNGLRAAAECVVTEYDCGDARTLRIAIGRLAEVMNDQASE